MSGTGLWDWIDPARADDFLYGDNVDGNVSGAPVALLRRLIAKAGVAFQIYIMKSKLRQI